MDNITNLNNIPSITDGYERRYYIQDNNEIISRHLSNDFGTGFIKGISCNNGIKKISFFGYPAITSTASELDIHVFTENKFTCNNPDTNDGPVNNIETKDITGTKLIDLVDKNVTIDCGNRPITYLNIAPDTKKIQYSCGNNVTGSNVQNKNLTFTENNDDYFIYNHLDNDIVDNNSSLYTQTSGLIKQYIQDKYIFSNNYDNGNILDCDDKVLTKISFNKYNGQPRITYICKNLSANNTTSNIAVTNENIYNTSKQHLIKKINVKTNDFRNPTKFWNTFDYNSTLPKNITQHKTIDTITNPHITLNCQGKTLTNISLNSDNTLSYDCGTPLKNLQDYSYEEESNPALYNYYKSGVMFDHVSCPNNSVLSGFSRTLTRVGPKIKWTCGNI